MLELVLIEFVFFRCFNYSLLPLPMSDVEVDCRNAVRIGSAMMLKLVLNLMLGLVM